MYRTLRGIFGEPERPPKRNFLKENVKNVRKINKSQSHGDVVEIHVRQPKKVNKTIPIKSYEKPTVNSIGRQKRVVQKKPFDEQSRTSSSTSTLKDQSSQTDINTKQEQAQPQLQCENCEKLNEKHSDGTNGTQTTEHCEQEHSSSSSISTRTLSDLETEHGENFELKRFQKEEKEPTVAPESVKRYPKGRQQFSKACKDSVEIPSNYKLGEIPEYLKKRKEELARLQKEIDEEDPCCPEGHILLPDEDRIKTLEIVNDKFQKLINELNRMPMTFLTQKMRKRQKEIEDELNKLEDSIRIFSRTKVYVKLND